jgi:hypothetical protein
LRAGLSALSRTSISTFPLISGSLGCPVLIKEDLSPSPATRARECKEKTIRQIIVSDENNLEVIMIPSQSKKDMSNLLFI